MPPISTTLLLLLALAIRPAWMYKEILELRMPSVVPTKSDAYLCHPFVIPKKETWYITSISPILDNPEAIHHIIVITCPVLGSGSPVWSCDGPHDTAFPKAPSCPRPNFQFMYDWTKDVDAYHFPPGVGFLAGADGEYRNLILQVHYSDASRFNESFRDSSGLKITFTRDRTPMLAGLRTLGGNGHIFPGRLENLESTCVMRPPGGTKYRVFSYLVHTHDLGLLVVGYRVRDGNWTEIARRSPQMPKAFMPTDITLQDGDLVVVRCFMYNFEDQIIMTGSTHHDEMCILRLLFYSEDGQFPPPFECKPLDAPEHEEQALPPRRAEKPGALPHPPRPRLG